MRTPERQLDVDSTLTGEKVGMTIDESALSHIMQVLTDLYADPEQAVIREYSTNALDAHVEAGEKRPIEVTTPTPLSPFFKVRDYGVGLDAEDIRDIYSRYGTSTKRGSDDVVGMLGLGCKSALTYADQFTLCGVKDGRRVQVSISRDADGSGSMTIVSDAATTEPNGVEVIVPAKRTNAFEAKADHFFAVWQPGTVLLNGQHPKRVDGTWITPTLLLTTEQTRDQVVMGNVAYPLGEDEPALFDPDGRGSYRYRYGQASWHTIAFVNIGDVHFTPSRESLQMDKHTKAKLAAIREEMKREYEASIKRQVGGAGSPSEAVQILAKAREQGFSGEAEYDGRVVPYKAFDRTPKSPSGSNSYIQRQSDAVGKGFLTVGGGYRRKKGGDWMWTADMDDGATVWFENFTGAELTAYKRDKLEVWSTNESVTTAGRRVILAEKYTPDEKYWLQGTKVYDFAKVEEIKIKKDTPTSRWDGRPRGSYNGRQNGTYDSGIRAETIDTTKPVLWIAGNTYTLSSNAAIREGVVPTDATVIALPANRIDKFKRDFPTAQRLNDYAAAKAKEWLAAQKPYDLEAYDFQKGGGSPSKLRALDESRVDDPDLARAIKMAKHKTDHISTGVQQHARYLDNSHNLSGKRHADPLRGYPLLLDCYTVNPKLKEHVYIYINAVKAAERKSQ